jgi:hypothetical protein
MKRLLFVLLFLPLASFSQCDTTSIEKFPDVDAQFPGGASALRKFIQENIEYPEIKGYAYHQPTGRAYLQFIVCQDGSIQQISILRSSQNEEVDQMGINLISKMPNWIPGEVNDLPVASLVRFPIRICLQ